MLVLNPPESFGIVEPGVYRSNIFDKQHFQFIAQLKLKCVVFLSMEAASRSLRTFLKQNNIRLVRLGFTTWREDLSWKPVNEELIKEGLEILLNFEKHPVLIMCTSGAHETGTLVGCLRRLQNWALSACLDEYTRFAGARARASNEQFIEVFDVDLISLPRHLPVWFKNSPNGYTPLQRDRMHAATAALPPFGGAGVFQTPPEDMDREDRQGGPQVSVPVVGTGNAQVPQNFADMSGLLEVKSPVSVPGSAKSSTNAATTVPATANTDTSARINELIDLNGEQSEQAGQLHKQPQTAATDCRTANAGSSSSSRPSLYSNNFITSTKLFSDSVTEDIAKKLLVGEDDDD
mmetsp:Transcript_3485/g.6601  ORF Transcript_3485/g.6601 Transcript_3485/m.6601 type:complete len:348 (+) Transcript_3485:21-1064(+)